MDVILNTHPRSHLAAAFLAIFAFLAPSLWADYRPPPGGELTPSWYSPLFMGGAGSIVTEGSPAADALNPAASARQQRFALDASYAALVGLGAEDGAGAVVNLGASIPQPYGVFGLGFRLFHSPSTFLSMPLGTAFDWRGAFSKEIGQTLRVGVGISGRFGSRAAGDWSLGADLGFVTDSGDISFMKNFRWGVVLAGLGKWYAPGDGVDPSGTLALAFPAPFTIKAGSGFDLIKTSDFRLWTTGDLSFPFFQNAILDLGMGIGIKDAFGMSIGWGANLRELIAGTYKSLIPSFGFTFAFPITTSTEKESFLSKQGWDRSELRPSVGVQPLYNGVWGFGIGVGMPLGVMDKKPPRITVKAPETVHDRYYLSPNADGKNDELSLPLAISDERYVMSWKLLILDADGKVVREIRNKDDRPEASGFKKVVKEVFSSKRGVAVPESVTWDGRSDAGTPVPDGVYTVVLESMDDNGNLGRSEGFTVAVDATAPALTLAPPADAAGLIFSPDGDGNRDEIVIKASGSTEDAWKVEVRNASGAVVRRLDKANGSLDDIRWDGKDDAGAPVPDGVYSFFVSSVDRGGNAANGNVANIVVDTAKTSVYATVSAEGFSPNGDGVQDEIGFGILVSDKVGISSWSLAISAMSDGSVKRRIVGTGSSIPEKLVWNGKSDTGERVPDGLYLAELSLEYLKGARPTAKTASFRVDTQAPKLSLELSPAPFSPDNDGEADELLIALGAADESGIATWSLDIEETAVSDTAAAGKSRLFMRYAGTGKPADIITWDGKSLKGELVEAATDYPCTFRATDGLGNQAFVRGVAAVDILVVRDGDRLKIKVPSIVFRPNFDDFKDLPADTVAKNMLVLERIAQTLNKYRSYKVRIEGHANNLGKIQGLSADRIKKEEDGEVIPLSLKRAEAVKAFLVRFKVDAARLSSLGLGSSEPVVDPTDAENRWKNRRVEFILEKK